ncbi:sulfotransferase domain-containing protein [Actinophytocola xinjiangensis]|uniref:sulfotransferase domain-containing protein n=1 Tax=Actinophytocola xinjiangensis TaxID=485602 RepID=UPI001B800813|nr:sulfotransferase domain-containing protein [Actinophytocola xinjiangensis]
MISTPAKSGTTWMQMLCALLIFDTPDLDRPLTEISPWLDTTTHNVTDVHAQLEAQRHRRFIKTHTPLDGLPHHPEVTYVGVGRDPRDVMVSFENATANLSAEARARIEGPPPADPLERFYRWADAEFALHSTTRGVTLANIVHHQRTFWDRRDAPNVALFHYQDLKADLPGELGRLAAALSIDHTPERITELAKAATFDSMRRRADELAPGVDAGLWRDNQGFFRTGSSGQWRAVLDERATEHYDRRVGELATPDLVAWLHPN